MPALVLPDSSEDLLIPKQYAIKITSIYEVFRRFRQLIRLTPFRMEDFCAAITSDEQSPLLAEMHIMLLRTLLREEDSQGTQFGPQDNKDSINISLYLIDQLTWPEALRSYLESHESFDKASLNILALKDYPFVSIEDRTTVLQFLTDQFLITDIVRGDLSREAPIIYDDHCRICHKLGDLVCCETCPAVFHLECVDPPLDNVPAGDYQCNLCKLQQVPGVYDCVSSLEKQGFLCRHEHLGYDRHGRKYWFINRRVFIEDEESGEVWYYSSVPQFKELLSKLDEDNMENALCAEINDFGEEIERQMAITESLTNKFKGHKKSYLEIENQHIAERMKKDRQHDKDDKINDSDTENNKHNKSDEQNEKSKTDEKDSTTEKSTNQHSKERDKDGDTEMIEPPKNVVSTRLKTGSLTPRNYNTDDLKRKVPSKDENDSEQRMTRLKNMNLNAPFKLGHENTFKNYVNQYTINVYALNKPQRNEDRDKKRPLSHKFSLTQASEFKWNGILNGNRNSVIATLRSTLIALDQAVSSPFMHPHWSTLRKLWLQAVASCNKPTDFAKVLIIFQICSKNCIYVNAWHEQLAHTRLDRITSMERDEKKKIEKREKRERDDEEERNRLAINFVKYSIPQKHQVAKQKGEEYRIHGQWSWIWMSYGRRQHSNKGNTGERIKPAHITTKIQHNDVEKIVSLEPSTYEYLKDQIEIKNSSNVPVEISKTKILPIIDSFDRLDVSSALTAENRLLYPKVAKKSSLDDLLKRRLQLKSEEEQRIERRISSNDEPLANVITKPKGRKLTDTEKLLKRLVGIKGSLSSANTSTNGVLSAQNIDMDYVNDVADTIIKSRDKFAQLNRLGKQYKCYPTCESNTSSYALPQVKKEVCSSPLCLQKARVKEELLIALKKSATHGDGVKDTIMNIVNRRPTLLEQKLTEGKANLLQNNSNDLTVEINPIKLQRSFLHALEKSCASNSDKDIFKHIIVSEPKDEILAKELKQEDTEKMDVDDNKSETNQNNYENTNNIKMNTDEDASISITDDTDPVETTIDDDIENSESNDKNDSSDGTNGNSRERRSSRRSIKKKSSVKTTTTSTKTTTKYSDGSEDINTNSITKTRSKDISFNANRTSTNIMTTNEYGQIKYQFKPNRRFNVVARTVKREDKLKIEKETAADGSVRIFSTSSTCGKVYLAKISTQDHDPLKSIGDKSIPTTIPLKYPPMNSFLTKKGFRSIMILNNFELRKLARCSGKLTASGFNPFSKSNTAVWPYPCARPLFKTCWLFRTLNARTLAAVAMQLRILWVCLRWDDMTTKPPTFNGKVVNNTDTGIVSTEILKSRIRGRFSERTEFLRFTLVIPYGYADPQPNKGKIIEILLFLF